MSMSRIARYAPLAAVCLLALAPAAVWASPLVTSAQVSLHDPLGLGDVGPDLITVGTLPSIQYGDSSQIGNATTGVLLPGETIDVTGTSLIYHVEGGLFAPDCPMAGYGCTGYGQGAYYQFSNLQFDTAGTFITGVSVMLTDAEGISLGSGVSFTGDSVQMGVGGADSMGNPGLNSLGIVSHNNGTVDFGTIELDLTFGIRAPTVPEPASGTLFALGLILALARTYRRRV